MHRRDRVARQRADHSRRPRRPPRPHPAAAVHHHDLGALALLAQLPPDAARGNADVAAIARIAANPDDPDTLDAYCTAGSLRRAADLLHPHHSSVARRLDQLATSLGIDLTQPTGLLRANLALTTWRLLTD